MFAALAALAVPAPALAQQCLSYGPATLQGRLYAFEAGDDGEGDITRIRRTDYYALVLAAPACIEARPGDDLTPAERRITIVQLGGLTPNGTALVGREVEAAGELAPAHPPHHHTEVLMAVRSLQLLDGSN